MDGPRRRGPERRGVISDIVDREWDVIVIGTGMGGGTLGRRLAEAGQSVLFLDRGPGGLAMEQHGLNEVMADPFARQIRGFWPTPVRAESNELQPESLPPLGAGMGGTSVFYAASLERPERHDFEDLPGRPHPTGGWAASYGDFEPYFREAEKWFHVCGGDDPLSPDGPAGLADGPALSEGDRVTMEDFRRGGWHPYRAHIGIRYLPGCTECIGAKCPRDCKMDGRSAGVKPALATGNAHLLDNCTVRRLVGTKTRIDRVEAVRGGETLSFRGRHVVLAAGALSSPRLLLASASEDWPDGCANESGLVGCNLMLHLNEMIAIWPSRKADFTGPAKTISVRDFYHWEGQRFGLLQSMGLGAEYGNVFHFLGKQFDRSAFRHVPVLKQFLRLPALAAVWFFGGARIYSGILEDLPTATNRVVHDPARPDEITVKYQMTDAFEARRQAYRRVIRRELRKQRLFFLTPDPELNYAHACGTLRFGADPAKSVVDADCKAHSIDNLHVADASFMPTSTGVNPSLTNAANAMRVADAILRTGS